MAFDGTFSRLTADERQALFEGAERRAFTDGQVIIRQGQPLDAIYVIAKGHVRVARAIGVIRDTVSKDEHGAAYKISVPGHLLVKIARLSPGAILGEMSFVDRDVTSAHVIAEGAVETLCIDRALVQRFMDKNAGFAGRFYHSLAIVLSNRLRLANANKRARRR